MSRYRLLKADPSRCCRCRGPKSASRQDPRCRECERDYDEAKLAKGDRVCSRCRVPLGERRHNRCAACLRAYKDGRKLETGTKRPAKPQPLPGLCEICREPAAGSLCRSCGVLANNWSKARVKQDVKEW